MSKPDFEQAKQYVLERLQQELPPTLFYHDIAHTRDDVLPAAKRLAALVGVNEHNLLLLCTAACFHDIGFVEQYTDNEAIAARIAAEVLPRFGYSPADVQTIHGLIMVTKLPQSPRTLLEEIMADADLDVLGRDDFFPRSLALRDERAAFGYPSTEEEWYTNQLKFLQDHRYFTPAARALRDAKKQRNIEEMIKRLESCRAKGE